MAKRSHVSAAGRKTPGSGQRILTVQYPTPICQQETENV
jgi:hypothetical protein